MRHHLCSQIIMRLMCDFALNDSRFETEFAIDFREHFADGLSDLKGMESGNLLELRDDG